VSDTRLDAPEPDGAAEALSATWDLPDSIKVADEIDLLALDPAMDEERGRRFCVAQRAAGGRCTAPALRGGLLCSPHAGLLDSAAGGKAKAEKLKAAQGRAEDLDALRRLGVRGTVAATLHDEVALVAQTVRTLLAAAAQGDIQAAKAVIPYLNQGLGLPTERLEVLTPDAADLGAMDTAQLAALVAQKRAAMRVVDEPADESAA
jgi:hypothetical protein